MKGAITTGFDQTPIRDVVNLDREEVKRSTGIERA